MKPDFVITFPWWARSYVWTRAFLAGLFGLSVDRERLEDWLVRHAKVKVSVK